MIGHLPFSLGYREHYFQTYNKIIEAEFNSILEHNNVNLTVVEWNTNAVISGHPASKLVTTANDPDTHRQVIAINYWTIIGDRIYRMKFITDDLMYPFLLPIIHKMMSTIRIDQSFKFVPKIGLNTHEILIDWRQIQVRFL